MSGYWSGSIPTVIAVGVAPPGVPFGVLFGVLSADDAGVVNSIPAVAALAALVCSATAAVWLALAAGKRGPFAVAVNAAGVAVPSVSTLVSLTLTPNILQQRTTSTQL